MAESFRNMNGAEFLERFIMPNLSKDVMPERHPTYLSGQGWKMGTNKKTEHATITMRDGYSYGITVSGPHSPSSAFTEKHRIEGMAKPDPWEILKNIFYDLEKMKNIEEVSSALKWYELARLTGVTA